MNFKKGVKKKLAIGPHIGKNVNSNEMLLQKNWQLGIAMETKRCYEKIGSRPPYWMGYEKKRNEEVLRKNWQLSSILDVLQKNWQLGYSNKK